MDPDKRTSISTYEEILDNLIGDWWFTLRNQSGKEQTGVRTYERYNNHTLQFNEQFDDRDLTGKGYFGYNTEEKSFYELSIFNVTNLSEILIGTLSSDSNKIEFEFIDPFKLKVSNHMRGEFLIESENSYNWITYMLENENWVPFFTVNFSKYVSLESN